MTFWKWSKTAASNGTADSTCPFPEGMAASAVNDGVRGAMAALAKWRDDISGAVTTSGSSTAYTVTSNQSFDTLAHMDNAMIAFVPHTTNGSAPTLSVDGLTAKKIRMQTGIDIPDGVLIEGTPYVVTYFNTAGEFVLHGLAGNPYSTCLGGLMIATDDTPPNSAFVLPYGQAISRTTYSTYFAKVGTKYGTGDGSTTFNVVDLRGRGIIFKDDMGGTAAERATTDGSGIDGATIGATGGGDTIKTIQRSDLPNVDATVDITDPGHNHGAGDNSGVTNTTSNIPARVNIGNSVRTTTEFTGITAKLKLNGGVTQTTINTLPPSIVLPVFLRVI